MKKINLILLLSLLSINQSFAFDLPNPKDLLKNIKQLDPALALPSNIPSEPAPSTPSSSQATSPTQKYETQKATNSNVSSTNILSPDEYCDAVTNNPDAQEFAATIIKIRELGVSTDEISRRASRSLNSPDKQLSSFVLSNINSIGKGDQDRIIRMSADILKMADECAAKNVDKPIFLFFAESPERFFVDGRGISRDQPDVSSKLAEKYRSGARNLIGEDGKYPPQVYISRPTSKDFVEHKGLSSRLASIFAFAFPNSSEVIHKSAGKNSVELLAIAENESSLRKTQAVANAKEEDENKYGGLRAVYQFRKNVTINPSYNSCLASEKTYQTKITSQIEKESASADTKAQQAAIAQQVSFRKKNIDYISHGMCLYRLNVGINSLASSDEFQAVMGGTDFQGRNKEDLNNKFTPNATKKIAEWLSIPAEDFHKKKIQDALVKLSEDVNAQRQFTRSQRAQVASQNMLLNSAGGIIYSEISEKIIQGFIDGKIQK